MSDQATLSLIVPVFNAQMYLQRCLDSALDQRLPGFEIIIVDDASTDDSPRIIHEYAQRDSRIVSVRQPANLGLHEARIDGYLASSGEYLAYLDSDDYLAPDVLSCVYDRAVRERADIVRMSADIVDEEAPSETPRDRSAGPLRFADAVWDHGIEYLKEGFYPAMWLHVHRRSLWERALPYFPRMRLLGEDNLTSFVLAFFAGRVLSLSQVGYFYVERAGALTTDLSFANIANHIRDRATIIRLLGRFVSERGSEGAESLKGVAASNRSLLVEYVSCLRNLDERNRAIAMFEEHWGEKFTTR